MDKKLRFLQLINSTTYEGEPLYEKAEVLKIMKEEFNMSEQDVSIMAKGLHKASQTITDLFNDKKQNSEEVDN